MALDERCNRSVAGTFDEVAFPVAWYCTVFHFSRPLSNRNRVNNLTAVLTIDTGVARMATYPLGAQVVHQLFFQHSAGLNEQTAVNRFVRHLHALVIGEGFFEPA